MKNLAEKATEKAAVLGLSVLSLTANAKEAGKEYKNLDFKIKTELTTLKAQTAIDTQTYDATADFQNPAAPRKAVAKFPKSREKNDKWIDPAEIEKRYKDAQRVIKLLGGLEGEDLDAKAKAEKFSIKYLTDLVEKLEEVRQQYDKFDSRGGSEATEEDDIANSNGEKKFSDIQDQVYDIIIKLKKYRAKKEITDLETGEKVTDYNDTKLDNIKKKLGLSFKEDTKGRVKVYINEEYANFDIFNPRIHKSYEIYLQSKVFKIERKNGTIVFIKIVPNENNTQVLIRGYKNSKWRLLKTCPAKNPAKKEVSMSH